jgi:hypothetical protein
MTQCRVIVISGAIASGKTTVTQELAMRARAKGLQTVAINMDDLVEMVMGSDWLSVTRTHLRLARRMAISLVENLSDETDLIFIAGDFFNPDDRAELRCDLESVAPLQFVTLPVPLAEALQRCQADPTRVASKDPALVTRIYDGIDWSLLPGDEPVISTSGATVQDTATLIAERFSLP